MNGTERFNANGNENEELKSISNTKNIKRFFSQK